MRYPKSGRLKRTQILAIAFLTLAGTVNYFDRSTLSIANHSISQELGLSASQMGLLLSGFSLAYAFAQLPVGALLDRFGSRVVLGLGILLWSAAQFAGGFIQTLNQFFYSRLVLGVCEAPLFPAGVKVISEWFAARERGGPTGIYQSSSAIGPMLGPPILTALMLSFGWRQMFVLMGAIGIVIALGWIAFYRNRAEVELTDEEAAHLDEGENAPFTSHAVRLSEWASLFRQRNTWGMVLGFMGVIYMIWLYVTWLPAYLEHERHLSIARTGWVVAIPYVFGVLGMCSSGFFADFIARRGISPVNSRKWPVCIGLVGAASFTVPAAYTPSTTMAVMYLCLAMFFLNLASGGAWALVGVAAPRRLVASLGGMQNFGGYLGGSLAPILTGVIVDRTHSFVDAFLISAAIALVAALVYLFVVKETRTAQLVEEMEHAA
ncbi:MFS transporter [Paraburkholderia sp. HD33-4]|uniref:MFS transporter n=1 Tax=Paraburkholderia sp. HD33-4 TaxID=2883242 RepID=UPI001F1F1D87|nr:MFS transporter [Paraburkholderia sp. HD33-4]